MIYLPKHFEVKDRARTLQIIRDCPFATLVSVNEGAPVLNHLPLILDSPTENIGLRLLGHMSTRNPQASHLGQDGRVTAIFHGPHTYITPTWYVGREVPTWNYVVIHVSGRIRWIREFKPLISLLRKMTDAFEGDHANRWRFALPNDLQNEAELTSAIVGFEIDGESVESKFKLSQNRASEDREGVLRGLESRSDEMSRRVLELMRGQPQ